MGRTVIVAYRPKPGRDAELLALLRQHLDVLSAQGLVTQRPAWLMRASDGTLIEVFEWKSAQAIERAHDNAAVGALWARFDACCDYVPLETLAESGEMFAEFEALPP